MTRQMLAAANTLVWVLPTLRSIIILWASFGLAHLKRVYKDRRFSARTINLLKVSFRQDMQSTSVSAEGGANPRHPAARSSDDVELSNLARNISAGDPITVKQAIHTDAANDNVVQTKAQRHHARVQFATLCWTLYLAGWNDGSTGPLLPRIQRVYDVSVPVIVHGTDVDRRTGQFCGGVPHLRVFLHRGCRLDFSVGVVAVMLMAPKGMFDRRVLERGVESSVWVRQGRFILLRRWSWGADAQSLAR